MFRDFREFRNQMTEQEYILVLDKLLPMNSKDIGDVFEEAFDLWCNGKFVPGTREDDVYGHCDRRSKDNTRRIDIKAPKKYKRNDKFFAEDTFMLEWAHVFTCPEKRKKAYRKGWLFGNNTHLAIGYVSDNSFYFLIFNRQELVNWCKSKGYGEPGKRTKRLKGNYEKEETIEGDVFTWKYDYLVWVTEKPEEIGGLVMKICIDKELKQLLLNESF